MKQSFFYILLFFFILVLLHPGNSPAQTDEVKAKNHFKTGTVLYDEGNYAAALVEFKASYKLKSNWKVRYYIGVTLQALHRFVEAEEELKAYLKEGGSVVSEEKKTEVQDLLSQLSNVIGSLVVKTGVLGASVYCDGDVVGVTPISDPIRLDVGHYEVEVKKVGYLDFSVEIDVPGGEVITLDVKLKREEPTTEEAASMPTLEKLEEKEPVEEKPLEAGIEKKPEDVEKKEKKKEGKAAESASTLSDKQAGKKGKRLQPGLYKGLGGLTGLLLAGTVTMGGLALWNHNEWENTRKTDTSKRNDLKDRGEKFNLATDILIGITAASALATVLTAVFTDFSGKSESQTALLPSMAMSEWGGLHLTLTRKF